jgi:EAL domain-containing protein (putative c-di-GMP-specific phosphodiesterase class I)
MFKEPANGIFKKYSCKECLDGIDLEIPFSIAFQPIVDISTHTVFSQEALVRGPNNESAFSVLSKINRENIYKFDQSIRVRTIQMASKLDIQSKININFFPNAVYKPESCIRTTLEACELYNVPKDRLIFEVTEGERIPDYEHLKKIFNEYRKIGLHTAIDDFGEGYSGLNLLSEFLPEYIKLDMKLIRDIHISKPKRVIVSAIVDVCHQLDIIVIAEGVEIIEEFNVLREIGIKFYQGYLFAKPSFESLNDVYYPSNIL